MKIEFLDLYFPSEAVADTAVVNLDGEVASLIETVTNNSGSKEKRLQ